MRLASTPTPLSGSPRRPFVTLGLGIGLALGLTLGHLPGALAGTVGAFEITNAPLQTAPVAPILALQDNVTYRTPAAGGVPANETLAGFIVGANGSTVRHVRRNTINRVTVIFEATLTDPAQTFTFRDPELYLAGLPSNCSWDNLPANRKTITCFYRQTRQGDVVLPSFAVFFNAPAKVINGVADAAGTDAITTGLRIVYAEGSNGPKSQPENSDLQIAQARNVVRLGTSNPVSIKSAVSRGGAPSLVTGDGGLPVNQPGKRLTQLLSVPPLTQPYTVASIDITADNGLPSVSPTLGDSNCQSAGNLKSCPVYETTIVDPVSGLKTQFLDPARPLVLVYRVDGSNLKRSAQHIPNAVLLTYRFNAHDVERHVGACTNGAPNADGTPCLLVPPKCFADLHATAHAFNGATLGLQPELVGDCEWVTISRGNGFVRLR